MTIDPMHLKPDVSKAVTLSLPTIWREQKAGRFPKWERLSAGRVGLRQSRLVEWLEGRRDWSEDA